MIKKQCDNIQESARLQYVDYILLFVVGGGILFFRSAYNLITPSMYTEDGVWLSGIMNDGFLHTLFNARSDYFVFGNIILLQTALSANTLFCGENLNYLPVFVALVQYGFYSLTAILPVVCLRRDISKKLRFMLWGLILLVPLGNSGYEIWGKISNTGYLFYFIACCLLYERIFNWDESGKGHIVLIDIVLFICCGTNEVCFILVGFGFLLDVVITYFQYPHINFKNAITLWMGEFRNRAWIVLGIACAILLSFDTFILTGVSEQPSGNPENVIEFFARSLLFYFIYPIYFNLNDGIVLLIFACILCGIFLVFRLGGLSKLQKIKLAVLISIPILYSFIACAFRFSLTARLDHYSTTWVDRYYYATNIVAILPVVYVAGSFIKSKVWIKKMIALGLCLLLLAPPAVSLTYLFQYDDPQTTLTHQVPFSDRINEAVKGDGLNYTISIDFDGWSMSVPEEYIIASKLKQRSGKITDIKLQCYNLTDPNWTNGIGNGSNILLFGREAKAFLDQCKALQVGENIIMIQEVKDMEDYIWVICDRDDVQLFAYPQKITPIFGNIHSDEGDI